MSTPQPITTTPSPSNATLSKHHQDHKTPSNYEMSEEPRSGSVTDDDVPEEALKIDEYKPEDVEYPEGGARGWAVAIGAATILFSTFGYANAFGYDPHPFAVKEV